MTPAHDDVRRAILAYLENEPHGRHGGVPEGSPIAEVARAVYRVDAPSAAQLGAVTRAAELLAREGSVEAWWGVTAGERGASEGNAGAQRSDRSAGTRSLGSMNVPTPDGELVASLHVARVISKRRRARIDD